MTPPDDFLSALAAEAMKKTAVCWVRWQDADRQHPVWHLWHDGAAYVVSGSNEQPLPGARSATRATVTARTKDSRARLISWQAEVTTLEPRTPEWDDAVALLQAQRLNLPAPGTVADRWATECTITQLIPTGAAEESPGDYPDGDLAAAPVETGATTRGVLPRVLHRRQTRRPKLR